MGVQKISTSATARQSVHTRALGRAVELALRDIREVQSHLTEEVRAEDAIRDLALRGTEVHVQVDARHPAKRDGLRALVKDLLATHGAPGARVELYDAFDAGAALEKAQRTLASIHTRRTRETRVEDGVASFALRPDGKVAVVLKPRQSFDEELIRHAVTRILKDAGFKAPKLDFVRAAIEPVPPSKLVADANAAIKQVQQRRTTDVRAEDDIVNLAWSGNSVKVVLRPRPHFSQAEIGEAVKAHLERAGLRGATLEVVRPAINPFDPYRPPVVAPTAQPHTMKAKVEELDAHVRAVQSAPSAAMTVAHAIASVRTVGATVEVKYFKNQTERFGLDALKSYVADELARRGVTLPVTFVKKDGRDV